MEGIEHKGKNLSYITIHPDGYRTDRRYPLVILLHGFGANMYDLASLCPAINREGYIYACPNAHLPFRIGPGMVGYGWVPPRGMATAEEIQHAKELLESFFDEVMRQYKVPAGQVVLLGFSQGGSMTYRLGLSKPDVFAALVILSGSINDPEEIKGQLPPQRTQPVFIAHGIHDELVPVERARVAKAFLEAEGYHLYYKEYAMGHEISQEVLDDLVPWIKEVLPPLALDP